MGKYDNYSNIKNIKKAQKRLKKLQGKKKPNIYEISIAAEKLRTAKLFESCQIFGLGNVDPNTMIMFSDGNRVMMFVNKLIYYDDIKDYRIVERLVQNAYTSTNTKGALSRAIVGDMIAGDIGAVVGAASAGADSHTVYYTSANGFYLQIFLKNGEIYQCDIPKAGISSNKYSKGWGELLQKIRMIIKADSESQPCDALLQKTLDAGKQEAQGDIGATPARNPGKAPKLKKNQLVQGVYKIGQEIPAGIYDFHLVWGSGRIEVYCAEETILGNLKFGEWVGEQQTYEKPDCINVRCEEGWYLHISGNIIIEISRANNINICL